MEVQPALALPEGLQVTGIEKVDAVLIITPVFTHMQPCCPLCGSPAARVHSRSTRKPGEDLGLTEEELAFYDVARVQ